MKNVVLIFAICLFSNLSSAQESNNIIIEAKERNKADIYIDGIKYDHAILELLDQSKIESVSVLKGDLAIKEYDAPNGVIVIKSKANNNTPSTISINSDANNSNIKVDIKGNPKSVTTKRGHPFNANGYHSSDKFQLNKPTTLKPLILIDGDTATQAELQTLNPDMIKSINVLKDQKAIEEYDAPNGVILVITKK